MKGKPPAYKQIITSKSYELFIENIKVPIK